MLLLLLLLFDDVFDELEQILGLTADLFSLTIDALIALSVTATGLPWLLDIWLFSLTLISEVLYQV